jgi:peptidoglycan/xylan/chitin deacetylase (PgdA/CDA1 family)
MDDASALALTFDNLGEAADLERGDWPAGAPLGRHPSVTRVLPRLLDALDALGLRATFCVEALNCELYPEAVAGIAARGHELGIHGWRHETWDELEPAREQELLARSVAAFAAIGAPATGFRPPGGGTTAHTAELLRGHGLRWISPEGATRTARDGLASVPFAWPLVDAVWRMESFAALRQDAGGPQAPLGPDETAERLLGALRRGAPPTLILHPFLMDGDDAFAAAERVLDAVAGRAVTLGAVAAALP